jgi:aerobic carbon-monoxide dehydrogenase medium subunit
MKPASFDLLRPTSLAEALDLLARHGDDAKLIAGGQSLVPMMNFRLATPSVLVDLNRIDALRGIRLEDNRLHIGAMTRQREFLTDPLVRLHAPLLARAAKHVGHVQTRSRGTLGGSLAHADPAAELCLAAAALDAEFSIRSPRGSRVHPARDFFKDALATDLAPDEVLTAISVPVAAAGQRCVFREYARRHGDFAIVGVAVQRTGLSVQAAVGGVETVPHHCGLVAAELARPGFDIARLKALVAEEIATLAPISDLQSGGAHRLRLAAVLLEDCLREVLL